MHIEITKFLYYTYDNSIAKKQKITSTFPIPT